MAAPARARRIAIVDYHKGNLSSVLRSVTEAGGDASVVDDPAAIAAADAVAAEVAAVHPLPARHK